MNTKENVAKFIAYARRYDSSAPNKNWYVGITSQDPDTRRKQHENKNHITCEHFRSLVTGQNKEDARELEKELNKVGFAITKKELMEYISESDKDYSVYIYKRG